MMLAISTRVCVCLIICVHGRNVYCAHDSNLYARMRPREACVVVLYCMLGVVRLCFVFCVLLCSEEGDKDSMFVRGRFVIVFLWVCFVHTFFK